ncbi:AAA family ATPase [Marinomonas transparens]|uniref:Histidine kinase n=1 Tax=Marinomonas transparens TaxID=2795388 RepID=A0A934JKP4_9GAMM|nr:histidine kinase [Marinomonas transparens]MBJ7536143.1 histidine kinase [Marinomonas transparens]
MSDMNPTESDGQQPLVVFSSNGIECKAFEENLTRLGYASDYALAGGVTEAIDWVKSHTVPPLLFVDIDDEASPFEMLAELSAICGPVCSIVPFGSKQSVDLYRALLANGMFDYLAKPVPLDMLANTIQGAEKGAREESLTGRTIAVTGASGGVGVTLVSVGLAKLLSEKRHLMTSLVDFDRKNGVAALMLGHQGEAGLAGALNADNIDTRLLRRSIGKAAERLYLVAQQPDFYAEEFADSTKVLELGGSLCRMFNQVVWDLPAAKPHGSLDVLLHAQTRIIVTDFTVTDARNTLRLLKELGDETSGQRILLVHNDARHAGKSVITQKAFEDFVGRQVDVLLPHVGVKMNASLLEGKVSFDACPELVTPLLKLADLACGRPPEAEQGKPVGIVKRIVDLLKPNKNPTLKFKRD